MWRLVVAVLRESSEASHSFWQRTDLSLASFLGSRPQETVQSISCLCCNNTCLGDPSGLLVAFLDVLCPVGNDKSRQCWLNFPLH